MRELNLMLLLWHLPTTAAMGSPGVDTKHTGHQILRKKRDFFTLERQVGVGLSLGKKMAAVGV